MTEKEKQQYLKRVERFCEKKELTFTLNDDMTVDLVGEVELKKSDLNKEQRLPFRIRRVEGHFGCQKWASPRWATGARGR